VISGHAYRFAGGMWLYMTGDSVVWCVVVSLELGRRAVVVMLQAGGHDNETERGGGVSFSEGDVVLSAAQR
jgi:hypothetical protein